MQCALRSWKRGDSRPHSTLGTVHTVPTNTAAQSPNHIAPIHQDYNRATRAGRPRGRPLVIRADHWMNDISANQPGHVNLRRSIRRPGHRVASCTFNGGSNRSVRSAGQPDHAHHTSEWRRCSAPIGHHTYFERSHGQPGPPNLPGRSVVCSATVGLAHWNILLADQLLSARKWPTEKQSLSEEATRYRPVHSGAVKHVETHQKHMYTPISSFLKICCGVIGQ